ncbi:MAG TPA: 50S ribosomal protein L29 [bacterium]|nr:MAG: 50S ribosomal protein L29 [Parcubacteria group bacterium ADurb.Bin192]HPN14702.1 50S ribosomal protein L29 [bacterium]
MKAKDLKQLTQIELQNKASELRGFIRDLRFKVTTRQNSKVRDLLKARKDLARVLTMLSALNKK